jgi:hypothetical protein
MGFFGKFLPKFKSFVKAAIPHVKKVAEKLLPAVIDGAQNTFSDMGRPEVGNAIPGVYNAVAPVFGATPQPTNRLIQLQGDGGSGLDSLRYPT